jgi:hypothetical protein
MSKHTPGPWRASNATVYAPNQNAPRQMIPIKIESGWLDGAWESDDEAHANARLIAAAPEMLEALELIDGYDGDAIPVSQVRETVRAALAKARGE